MKKTIVVFSVLALMVSCVGGGKEKGADGAEVQDSVPVETPVEMDYGVIERDNYRVETKFIRSGEALGSIMSKAGVKASVVNSLGLLPDTVFDTRLIKAGNEYSIYYTNDSLAKPHYLVYEENKVNYAVFHVADSLMVTNYKKPIDKVDRMESVTINNSLWVDVCAKDLNPQLAIELSDIFAWTVDFFALQKGDNFTADFTEEYVDSVSIGVGKVKSARFYHNGKEYHAIYFAKGDIAGYWDLEGNSIKKAFLKAPLSFSRISSGFTYARKHPVYKTVRPHTGVDYAAPMGTPVMSIGDGVVVWKGYKGGGGHTVKIKHNGTYTSAYLHLSRYGKGVAVGARVSQGQVIGYVGSTGASTGPHLDFRIWKHGQPINPLTMDSPPTEPLPAEYMEEFGKMRDEYLKKFGISIDN